MAETRQITLHDASMSAMWRCGMELSMHRDAGGSLTAPHLRSRSPARCRMAGEGGVLVARLEVLGEVDRRGAIRFVVDGETTARGMDGTPVDVIVEDFSRTGFRFVGDVDFPVGTLVSIGLAGAGAREAKVIRRDGPRHGCEFLVPLPQSVMKKAFRGQEEVVAALEAALARATAPAAVDPEPPQRPRPGRWSWIVRLLRR